MVIIDYFNTVNPGFWLSRLSQCDWTGGQYLHQLLKEDRFHTLCGEKARVLLNGRQLAESACGRRLITDEAGNPLAERALEA